MSVDHQAYCYLYGIKAQAFSLEGLHQIAHKRIIRLTSFKISVIFYRKLSFFQIEIPEKI